MPTFKGYRFDDLAWFAVVAAITAGCAAALAWCLWLGVLGTPGQQLRASYGAIPAAYVGVIAALLTQQLRPRRLAAAPRPGQISTARRRTTG